MITIEKAIELLKLHLPKRKSEIISARNANNRILAEDIFAKEAMPTFSNSAMDGFAVRWQDVKKVVNGNSKISLNIIGESSAGSPFQGSLQPNTAIRISTGAAVCENADTIIPIEVTDISENSVTIFSVKKQFQFIRKIAEEYDIGEKLVSRDTTITPPVLAILASQGIQNVTVFKKVKVAIFSTGAELIDFTQKSAFGEIRDSNTIMLNAAIENIGAEIIHSERISDNLSTTIDTIEKVKNSADIIIFSGGVSVGAHDFVKEAAKNCEFDTIFWRVKQKPGKPLFLAKRNDTLLFGLPGNPVSAYMCFKFYIEPTVNYLHGKQFYHNTFLAESAREIYNPLERTHFFRVSVDEQPLQMPLAYPIERQGSHMLTSVSNAGGFIQLDADATVLKGDKVNVFRIF